MTTTHTPAAPEAWAVEEIRRGEAFWIAQGVVTSSGREPYTPKTEEEVMAAAAKLQAEREAFRASPRGRILATCEQMQDRGLYALAESVRSAVNRGADIRTGEISPGECGTIIRVLDGINTEASRVILRAVADNLRSL